MASHRERGCQYGSWLDVRYSSDRPFSVSDLFPLSVLVECRFGARVHETFVPRLLTYSQQQPRTAKSLRLLVRPILCWILGDRRAPAWLGYRLGRHAFRKAGIFVEVRHIVVEGGNNPRREESIRFLRGYGEQAF